jgi:hypothetical protein
MISDGGGWHKNWQHRQGGRRQQWQQGGISAGAEMVVVSGSQQ